MKLADLATGSDWIVWIVFVIFAALSITLLSGHGSWFISGYNTASKEERKKYDEKKLCWTMGIGMSIIAIIAGVLGVLPRARKFSFIPAVIMIGVVCVDLSPALDKGAQIGIGAMSIILGGILAIIGSIVEFTKKKKSPLA